MKIKSYLFLTILCFISKLTFSQTEYSARIIDFDDGTPIAKALIIDLQSQDSVLSSVNGQFKINTYGKLSIMANSYVSTEIDLSLNRPKTISLIKANQELDEVIINSLSISSKLKSSTSSVGVIDNKDLSLNNTINLADVLNTVPGVFMQSGTLNTNRVTIRGIGARNLFGTANIRAYFGDIPLTDGNGESSIEDLELNTLSSIQILRGPSASSYGVGLGGAILFNPEFASKDQFKSNIDYKIGSYGYNKILLNSGIGFKKSSFNLTYSNIDYEGYRQNNEYKRQTLTLSSNLELSASDNLVFLGTLVNLKGGIPSSLSLNDFNENPRKAAFTWGRAKAFEDVDYTLLGISWDHEFNENLSLISTINTSFKNNYEPRPFNILEENSNSIGFRTRLLKSISFNKVNADFSLGVEVFLDNYKNKTFENLYEEFSDDRGSVKGDQLSGFKENRNYYNAFLEGNLGINDNLVVNIGLHLNQTNFKVKDNFQFNDLNNAGKFNFNPILSPKLGVNYTLNNHLIVFGNIAHGFSTPTTAETLLPEGEFNPDLRPEIGWNFEVGGRYYLIDNRLYGSVSFYSMAISDLLVARRTQEDDFFAINAGKAIHNGMELELSYTFLQLDRIKLISKNIATITDYRFKEFLELDNDFSNNLIPGVPLYNYNLGLGIVTDFGLRSRLAYQMVGKMAVNDANSEFSSDYRVMNIDMSYNNFIGSNLSYEFYVHLNNVFDESYASQLQINAIGFGNSSPRFYYPGLPFNFYTGFKFSYFL